MYNKDFFMKMYQTRGLTGGKIVVPSETSKKKKSRVSTRKDGDAIVARTSRWDESDVNRDKRTRDFV